MRKLRYFWLNVIACTISVGVVAPNMVTAEDEAVNANSFKALYSSTPASQRERELEIVKAGDADAKAQRFAAAAAKYLAAAREPLISNNFETARTNLDKAFLMASKMSVADQGEMLRTLSEIVGQCHNQMSLDAYKYLAQQRLKLLRNQPGASIDSQYHEVQTVAFACSNHKRYQEAISLLLETLSDLQTVKPATDNVGRCEETLARIYAESGDIENAKKYYELSIAFARTLKDNQQLTRVLNNYLHFLFDHNLNQQTAVLSEEYLKATLSPDQVRWRDRVSYGYFAEKLSSIDTNEADKFYRAAFDNERKMTEYAMNAGYGRTISQWADMLNKAGKTKEAIAVLNEGMEFCRHSKWPNAIESYMPEMEKEYEAILATTGDTKGISDAHAKLASELSSQKLKIASEHEEKLKAAIDDSHALPLQKVKALTEFSNKEFDSTHCDEAVSHLKAAVAVYEKNATDKQSEQMFDCFKDVSIHLKKCGHDQENESLLLRIVHARMVNGFDDPLAATSWHSHCGIGRTPVGALDDYLGFQGRIIGSRPDSKTFAKLEQLISEAKASNKPASVVFLLIALQNARGFNEARIDSLEELEIWRAKENDPRVLLLSMLQTEDSYLFYKKYDKFLSKWEAVKALHKQLKDTQRKKQVLYPALSGTASAFGDRLVADGQLKTAGQFFLEAYNYSLQEGREYPISTARERLAKFAIKSADSGDTQSGKDLLTKCLDMAQSQFGDDAGETRAWLIAIAEYYIKTNQAKDAESTLKSLITSINKPGMSIAPKTREQLLDLKKLLTDKVYADEAKKIEKRLASLDAEQCVAH
jgi:tetratricopeptide (TPR) repeat protein